MNIINKANGCMLIRRNLTTGHLRYLGLTLLLALMNVGCGVVPTAPEETPPPQPPAPYSSVKRIWGSSSGEVFLGCRTRGKAAIIRSQEGSWNTIWTEAAEVDTAVCFRNGEISAVWCSTDGSLFAAMTTGALLEQMAGQELVSACGPSGLGATAFNDIHGFSADNVYALELLGGVAHFDGASWSWVIPNVASPGTHLPIYLEHIWGPSPGSLYFSGGWERVYHFDGNTVTSEVARQGRDIGGLWGRSDTDIYATTKYGGTILHRDANAWTIIAKIDATNLSGLFGFDEGPVYVIARNAEGSRILVESSGSWEEHGAFPNVSLNCIWGNSPENMYAGGMKGSSRLGVLLHFDGTSWTEVLSLPI